MTDQNEFKSLDELFKNTFDNLPDTPAPSGWDQPSARVWDNLNAVLQPQSGFQWRWQYGAALAGTALVIIAGLYFFNQEQKQDAQPAPATQVEQTAAAQPAPQAPAQEIEEGNKQQTSPAPSPENMPVAEPPLASELAPNRIEPIGLAEQLPGSKPAPPNTTEQLKEELKYIWTFPVSTLPAPAIPSSIRRQPQ